MFIPLYDVNALKHVRLAYVTLGLIVVNFAVWLVTDVGASEAFSSNASLGLGYIPALFFDNARLDPSLVIVPEGWTYITYAFLHGNFWHVASNMLFLWVFGDNVEDAMGHFRFLLFYLLCAAAAAWFHGFLLPQSQGPLIGASGAISGVVASYFLLHPKVWVWVLVLWRIPLLLPAFVPLAFWILQQVYMLFIDGDGEVSWAAHVGGIVAGLALTPILKRWSVPLFDRRIVSPKGIEVEQAQTRPPQQEPPRWGRG
ncbi:rhomboid family intramembrane serine protease [Rhizobium sp. KVB221]|uniref:Rhomboid family intramembrane serine protease n=1 Tax=Rhizobium setariae TaxID=2801340 RepID=A0A937CPK2_9HYPH|nr:rhomboid family intramembrane serine protease [Rhizobium setariae]MBL0372638.1 rhomboid family intramembrane serine protease [Rhizobium setariae]